VVVRWEPGQYLKFADHRLRPAIDLLNRIDADPRTIVDLGAGTGNVTRLLQSRWPNARVTGVDSSPEMLARAADALPQISWDQADLSAWRPRESVDLLYSNAALHWVDDHSTLFPALFAMVNPGGTFAVQMPNNFGARSHTAIADVVRGGPWQSTLEPLLRTPPVQHPSTYFDLLTAAASSLDIWETEYVHVLEGDRPVLEWIKGTWLRPLLAALDTEERAQFESRYAELAAAAYPRRADARTLFPFRRLFIVARRRTSSPPSGPPVDRRRIQPER
jgi:trans-aconitate 2-methyltransferase